MPREAQPDASAQQRPVEVITHTLPADDDALVRERQIIGRRFTRADGTLVVEVGVLPISPSAWHRGVRAGRFPRGRKLGSATVRTAGEIRRLLADIAAGRL